jgi:hypothetical protein
LVDAYENYNCFGEVSIFIVLGISTWKKGLWLSLNKTDTEMSEIMERELSEERMFI